MSREAWSAKLTGWRAVDREQSRVSSTVVLLNQHSTSVAVLVAAWPNCSPRDWAIPLVAVPADDRTAWASMWPPIERLAPEVAKATGLPENECVHALQIAITNRIIYPDGSLTTGAIAYITVESANLLRKRARHSEKDKKT